MSDPKTIRIRACVAVGPDGEWAVYGNSEENRFVVQAKVSRAEREFHWIEAEVPAYPEPVTVEGEVVDG